MRDVLTDLERWEADGEEIAVATVIKTWGSAPRPSGSRFAMTRSGRVAGSVSGGCVEGDVFEAGLAVLESGTPRLLVYGVSDETAFNVGLSCGGTIEIFVERFGHDEALDAARRSIKQQQTLALATALAPEALSGRHMAVVSERGVIGSIDPGIDAAVAREAGQLLPTGGAGVLEQSVGGRAASIFIEALPPVPHVYIVGASHVGVPLCHMAKLLGYRVSVIDARRAFSTPERFPDADDLISVWPEDALAASPLDGASYVVILTHDPKFDLPTLALALRSDARYIGIIGSPATHERRRVQLREMGFGDEALARIHAPIGLDLGGRTPEEIALSILAEMTAIRHGRRDDRRATERGMRE